MSTLSKPTGLTASAAQSTWTGARTTPRVWSGAWERHAPLAAVVLLAVVLVCSLPIRAPWWTLVDSDGSYVGNALNLLLGRASKLLEHPALCLQELLSGLLYLDYCCRSIGTDLSLAQYVDATFADLDRTVPIVRACGTVFLLCGVVTAYEVVRRLTGRRLLGVIAALLYLAVPGHLAMAPHFRPENPLSALCLIMVYLLIRGEQSHRAVYYTGGAAVLGLALGVKVHALGVAPVLLLALWRNQQDDFVGDLMRSLTVFRRVWGRWIAAAAGLALLLAVWSNVNRSPASVDWKLLAVVGFGALYVAVSATGGAGRTARSPLSWLFRPAVGIAGTAVLLGVFVPVLGLLDELRPLAWQYLRVLTGAYGSGSVALGDLLTGVSGYGAWIVVNQAVPLVIVVLAAAVLDYRAGSWQARYWLVGAAGMLALALVRGGGRPSVHYLAPALTLLIPPVAAVANRWLTAPWAARGGRRPAAAGLAGLALVVVVVGPYGAVMIQKREDLQRGRLLQQLSGEYARLLAPDQVVMANYGALNEDASRFMLVKEYCQYTPWQPLATYPDTPTALREMDERGLTPAYYIAGPRGSPQVRETAAGRLVVTTAWGSSWHARLVARPGAGENYAVYRLEGRLP